MTEEFKITPETVTGETKEELERDIRQIKKIKTRIGKRQKGEWAIVNRILDEIMRAKEKKLEMI